MGPHVLSLSSLPSLTADDHHRLCSVLSIYTTQDLFEKTRTKSQRLRVCLALGVTLEQLWFWVGIADLCRIASVCETASMPMFTIKHAVILITSCSIQSVHDLLTLSEVASGSSWVKTLVNRLNDHGTDKRNDQEKNAKGSAVSVKTVQGWIDAANSLECVVHQSLKDDSLETLEFFDVTLEFPNEFKNLRDNTELPCFVADAAFRHFCCAVIYRDILDPEKKSNASAACNFLTGASSSQQQIWRANSFRNFKEYYTSRKEQQNRNDNKKVVFIVNPAQVTNAQCYEQILMNADTTEIRMLEPSASHRHDDTQVTKISFSVKEKKLMLRELETLPPKLAQELHAVYGSIQLESSSLTFLEAFARVVETYLRVFFASVEGSPSFLAAKDKLSNMSETFIKLQARGAIAVEPVTNNSGAVLTLDTSNRFPEAYILHEFFSFVTIVRDLQKVLDSQETLGAALQIGIDLCSHFPTEYEELRVILDAQRARLEDGSSTSIDRDVVIAATITSCCSLPCRDPVTNAMMKVLLPLPSDDTLSIDHRQATSLNLETLDEAQLTKKAAPEKENAPPAAPSRSGKRQRSNSASLTENISPTRQDNREAANIVRVHEQEKENIDEWEEYFESVKRVITRRDENAPAPKKKPAALTQSVLAWKASGGGRITDNRTSLMTFATSSEAGKSATVAGRATASSTTLRDEILDQSAKAQRDGSTATTGGRGGSLNFALQPYNGRWSCSSQYHAKFSHPARHGSTKCQWCAVCHMMEILFNGCTYDCNWKHWPTRKKVATHLARFPEVMRLAHKALDDMQRGIYRKIENII